MREGIAEIINKEPDLSVCATAESVFEALNAIEERHPEEVHDRFLGPVYALVGPRTGSAAVSLATLLQDYGRATLGAVAVAAISYGIYRVLKSQHKKRINRVIDNYDLKIDQFTGPQKDMMAAALNAAYHVPTYMTKLKAILIAGPIASESVNEQTMLKILASLYYKKYATDEDVALFKEIVTPVVPEIVQEKVVAESMES